MQTVTKDNSVWTERPWNFPTELTKLRTHDGIDVPNARAIVRRDTGDVLSVVSDRYRLITHEEVMRVCEPLVADLRPSKTDVYIEGSGKRMITQMTIDAARISVPATERRKGDVMALRVSIINSYDTTTTVSIKLGAMVLACLNGMTLAYQPFSLNFRHVWDANASERLADDVKLPPAEDVFSTFMSSAGLWKTWSQTEVDEGEQHAILGQAIAQDIVSETLVEKNPGLLDRYGRKTKWDLYNDYTWAITHGLRATTQQSTRLQRYDALNRIFTQDIDKF